MAKLKRNALIVLVFMVLFLGIGFAISKLGTEHALLLVTVDDCRRAFDEPTCRATVERAQAIHADTAPSFEQRQTCELIYGVDQCALLKIGLIELPRYAPKLVAILVTPTRDGIVPLYEGTVSEFGAGSDVAQKGRPVYFHGRRVGRLVPLQFGGGDATYIADEKGEAITAAAVRALHGK